MYICKECTEVFDEPKPIESDCGYETSVGYAQVNEEFSCCPHCGSEDIEIAKKCDICGEYTFENAVCDNCLEENATLENAIKYGNDEKVKVELNSFFAWSLSSAEINDILAQWCEENQGALFLKEFCSQNKYDFARWVKNENK